MGHFSRNGFPEEVPGHGHAGDGLQLTEGYGCCDRNGFIWNRLRERYMHKSVEMAEPAETG